MDVFFDIGHAGRIVNGRFNQDPGATYRELREVDLVESYVAAARKALRALGHNSIAMNYGPYHQRQAYANSIATKYPDQRFAYIACHVNSATTPGDYALVLHDKRSKGGKVLADKVAGVFSARVVPTSKEDWTTNAHETIDGIYDGPNNISAICFEPFFINHPSSASLCTEAGLRVLGEKLAKALDSLEK